MSTPDMYPVHEVDGTFHAFQRDHVTNLSIRQRQDHEWSVQVFTVNGKPPTLLTLPNDEVVGFCAYFGLTFSVVGVL